MKRLYITLFFLIPFAFYLVPSAFAQGVVYDYTQIVAKAGETPVTRGQLAEVVIGAYGPTVLDKTVKRRAYVKEAARLANITVSPDEVAQRVAEYKTLVAQFDQFTDVLGTRKVLDAVPSAMLDEEVCGELLAEKLLNITVSDDDARTAYDTNLDHFRRPLMINLVVIATADRTGANNALRRLRAGDDPHAVSAELSTELDVRAARGTAGWMAATGFAKPVFRDAVFGANRGAGLREKQYTDALVETDPQTHQEIPPYLIFYAVGVKPAWEPQPSEVMPAARFLARAAKVEAALLPWMKTEATAIPWTVVTPPIRLSGTVDYSQVIATAGKTTITRADLAEAVMAEYGIDMLDGEMKTRAFILECARLNGITTTPADVALRIGTYSDLVRRFEPHTDVLGTSAGLAATPHAVQEEDARTSILAEKVMGITVSDDDITNWNVENIGKFVTPNRVCLVLVLTDNYQKAKEAYARLKAGTDPRVVSTQYSTDITIANAQGEIGWYTRGTAEIKEASEAIFGANNGAGLKAGEFTNVIPVADAESGKTDFRIYYVTAIVDAWRPPEADARAAAIFFARAEKTRDAERPWQAKQELLITWSRVSTLRDPAAALEVVPPLLRAG